MLPAVHKTRAECMRYTGTWCKCKICKATRTVGDILYAWLQQYTNHSHSLSCCNQVKRNNNILLTLVVGHCKEQDDDVWDNVHFEHLMHLCTLVGSDSLVNPAAQVGHTGVHSRGIHVAVRGAPGDDTNERPHPTVLTDQGATWVTLKRHK